MTTARPRSKHSSRVLCATFALSLSMAGYVGCGSERPLGDAPSAGAFGEGSANCTTGSDFTGCPCTQGETKACYTGPATTRGVGACKDGVQTCTQQNEIDYSFGSCVGQTLPTAENANCAPDSCTPGECDPSLVAPRPISPVSTGRVSSWQPTLRWKLADGTDGARVTLCRDRACTNVIASLDATGSSVKVPNDLAPGVVYWKVAGRSGNTRGNTTGPVWQFVVGKKNAPADNSWGTMFDVNGDGFADIVSSAKSQGIPPSFPKGQGRLYVYHGGSSGLPDKPSSTLAAPADASYFAFTAGGAGDVNGDGYADAIVGTNGGLPGCTGGVAGYSPDQVWLYLGGPNGLSETSVVTLNGPNAGKGTCGATCPSQPCGPGFDQHCADDCDYFGMAVSAGGDINGDGYADVLVGANYGSAAYVYYGTATGVDPTPLKLTGTNSFGRGLSTVGDIDGDGYGDVVIGNGDSASLYKGSAAGLVTTPIALPAGPDGSASPGGGGTTRRTMDCAGDVNGDGYPDILTGSNQNRNYVYLGGPGAISTPPVRLGSQSGSCAASGGDLNGDGYSDILFGGTDWVEQYPGSASGTQTQFVSQFASMFNSGVVGAGDLDGDGIDDAVVARNPSNTGTITVFYSPSNGIVAAKQQVLLPPVGDALDGAFAYALGGSQGL